QRIGTYGTVLDYVEGHTVIKRLNDAFDGKWSFEILRCKILEKEDEVVVLGRLSADGVVKCQFGSSRITRAKDSGQIISLSDDLKAAATDSLKKCATMLGVGLYLYNGDKSLHDLKQGNLGDGHAETVSNKIRGNNSVNGQGRITNKQLNYLVNLARSLGLDSKSLDEESIKIFGVKMAYLTVKDASAFIDILKRKAA
ncbi:MAG: hypothetical protein JRI51_12760, partial [Deltaproteobacteria bacterium]|nr:hypothetical protein [Deltaproteobacteria bacterium]